MDTMEQFVKYLNLEIKNFVEGTITSIKNGEDYNLFDDYFISYYIDQNFFGKSYFYSYKRKLIAISDEFGNQYKNYADKPVKQDDLEEILSEKFIREFVKGGVK